RRICEHDIEPRIERLEGVASSFTSGGMQREIRVLVDPSRLRAYRLSIQQLLAALQQNNLQIPSGFLDTEKMEFTIKTAGEYTNLKQIEETALITLNGSVIRIKDVARVEDGFKEQRSRIWANDRPAVVLMVQKQSDANTVQVARNVNQRLPQIQEQIPEGVSIEIFWDQSDFINRSMANLGNTALQAIALAFLVLLFFLQNIRSSVIVAVSIPVSMVLTFAVMDQANLTLNIISMAGLALAVGLLVDNSIVVIESIFRFREQGIDAREAANQGSDEVSMAITASTLTTLSVFVPVLFVPGLSGQLFREMVITICFSLAVSLVVALTLIPLLSSRLIKTISNDNPQTGFLNRIKTSIQNGIINLRDVYLRALSWSLQHRKRVLLLTFLTFILSLVVLFGRGGEFLPESDNAFMEIRVERTPGVSLDEMEKTVLQMNRIIREKVPEAEFLYANFGQGEGVWALFSTQSSAEGEVNIRLPKRSERDRSIAEIEAVLRDKFSRIPDLKTTFRSGGMGAMFGDADIQVKLFGYDLAAAEATANQLESQIKAITGVVQTEVSLKESRPELTIDLDRQRIADLGLSTAQVGSIVSTSILGTIATRYRESGDEYDVRVQLGREFRETKQDLENIIISTMRGDQVPLRSLATIDYTRAPQQITREDQERYVSISINIADRDLQSVTRDIDKLMKNATLPRDFRYEIGGMAEDQQESFIYLGLAMMIAILLTYMVMASQFESLIDPFIILFTIPLSLIGVSFSLLVTGTTVSVMTLIGIIMLVGIVVNNGIVLVDYINQLRERGLQLLEAIAEAGKVRMRPVLMTALTTILAMLPLSLGLGESGESWAPMARAVMGGLFVATILTLIIVPVIYATIESFGGNMKRRFKNFTLRKWWRVFRPLQSN
ncbi:efflux RND transporter permease subunit, partial [candidate division KSB1 bacterium]|nr:efflux RND transporter permease subunit [candidate division KSB1 bacterium]